MDALHVFMSCIEEENINEDCRDNLVELFKNYMENGNNEDKDILHYCINEEVCRGHIYYDIWMKYLEEVEE